MFPIKFLVSQQMIDARTTRIAKYLTQQKTKATTRALEIDTVTTF